jgi:hypothetical protein
MLLGNRWRVARASLPMTASLSPAECFDHATQRRADHRDPEPLTIKAGYYELMRDRLVKEKIRFTYFIDSEAAKSEFLELYGKLLGDPALDSSAKKRLSARLRCIVVPTTLTIFGFVLFNPNVVGRMFGRSVVMDDYGLTIGVIPMDRPKVTASFEHLHKIVEKLEELGGGKSGAGRTAHIEGIGHCEMVKA